MFKFLKDRKKKDNKGFTLVELVIVSCYPGNPSWYYLHRSIQNMLRRSRKAADVSNMDEHD